MLSDISMNKALKAQYPHFNGLHLTLLQTKPICGSQRIAEDKIQIIHCRKNHWIVASSVGLFNEVAIYDSLYNDLDHETKHLVTEMFPGFKAKMVACQKQSGSTDCGLFAIANATAIAFSTTAHQFHQHNMRVHLLNCFKNNYIIPFT